MFGLQGLPSDPPAKTGLSQVDREPCHIQRDVPIRAASNPSERSGVFGSMLALPSRRTVRMCSPMCRSNQPLSQITWRTSLDPDDLRLAGGANLRSAGADNLKPDRRQVGVPVNRCGGAAGNLDQAVASLLLGCNGK